jgi:peptidoglycan hydrolase-like protein with peptidoglycan-binding domain
LIGCTVFSDVTATADLDGAAVPFIHYSNNLNTTGSAHMWFFVPGEASGSHTATVTFSGPVQTICGSWALSGVAQSNAVDMTADGHLESNGRSLDVFIVTAAAGEMLFGTGADNSGVPGEYNGCGGAVSTARNTHDNGFCDSGSGVPAGVNIGTFTYTADNEESGSIIALFPSVTSLRRGSSGPDVSALQKTLIAAKFLKIDAPTGYFGRRTETALKAFQKAHSLDPVGYTDHKTLALLNQGTVSTTTSAPLTGAQGDAFSHQIEMQIKSLSAQIAAAASASTTPTIASATSTATSTAISSSVASSSSAASDNTASTTTTTSTSQ